MLNSCQFNSLYVPDELREVNTERWTVNKIMPSQAVQCTHLEHNKSHFDTNETNLQPANFWKKSYDQS